MIEVYDLKRQREAERFLGANILHRKINTIVRTDTIVTLTDEQKPWNEIIQIPKQPGSDIDHAFIYYEIIDNRIVVFGPTENEQSRKMTCQLLVAAANVITFQPDIYFSVENDKATAVKFELFYPVS